MQLHLVDATYELFRAHYSPRPPVRAPDGRDVGAVTGLIYTLLTLLRDEGATHVGCATDHVIRSFRNGLYGGYKTEAGVPAELLAQFPLAERAMEALGVVVWPMVEFEADDALATAASRWGDRPGIERIWICTPDKDLAQCVRGERVVMRDRRRGRTIDETGVRERWGVAPESIPDYLALVGDAADGFPGLPGWGRAIGGRGAGPVRAPGGDPGGELVTGTWTCARRPASTPRCGLTGTRRCSTAAWPRCAWTCRSPRPTRTSCAGAERGGARSGLCARSLARGRWPNGRTSGRTDASSAPVAASARRAT